VSKYRDVCDLYSCSYPISCSVMVRIPLDRGVLGLAVIPGTVMAEIYGIGSCLDII